MDATTHVKQLLTDLFASMELPVDDIAVTEDEFNVLRANVMVDEKTAPMVIGVYGATLGAFQAVLKSLLWKKGVEEKSTVQLDINNYRQHQEERMVGIAREKAEAVLATAIPQSLPPMSPYMRRLVHLHLAKEFPDLETESIGEEGKRRIHIKKKQMASSDL